VSVLDGFRGQFDDFGQGGDETFVTVSETEDFFNVVAVGGHVDDGTDDIVETWAETSAGDDSDSKFGRVEEEFLARAGFGEGSAAGKKGGKRVGWEMG
jgi:hypothetical protein